MHAAYMCAAVMRGLVFAIHPIILSMLRMLATQVRYFFVTKKRDNSFIPGVPLIR